MCFDGHLYVFVKISGRDKGRDGVCSRVSIYLSLIRYVVMWLKLTKRWSIWQLNVIISVVVSDPIGVGVVCEHGGDFFVSSKI